MDIQNTVDTVGGPPSIPPPHLSPFPAEPDFFSGIHLSMHSQAPQENPAHLFLGRIDWPWPMCSLGIAEFEKGCETLISDVGEEVT